MLTRLQVNNFALIENAQIDVEKGFTVITGETGSGKSILLGALHLILGDRADYSVIRDRSQKTIVEATFQLDKQLFNPFFENHDLDFEAETIIRREINSKGKSRAFINDTPTQLSTLKVLTTQLIYIHSQHHTLTLKDKKFQLSFLDGMTGMNKELQQLTALTQQKKEVELKINQLEEDKAKRLRDFEYNSFQLEELQQLQLDKYNYHEIEQKLKEGEQFEELKEAFQLLSHSINGESGLTDRLNQLMRSISLDDSSLNELNQRIQSIEIELKDIGAIADDKYENLTYDPEEVNQLSQLLDGYNSVLLKHQLQTQEELISYLNELQSVVQAPEQLDEEIKHTQLQLNEINKKGKLLAEKVSKQRKITATEVGKKVAQLLDKLSLKGATIYFKFQQKEWDADGMDSVALYFAPNKGNEAKEVEKSASGGELSRLMLAIQFLLSKKKKLPTLLFDEIDTGVSGKAAQNVGELLANMGMNMQLIAITHLPQVASKGEHHLKVKKEIKKGITSTIILPLASEDRVVEIAKLMSGAKINEAAIMNAKNLLNNE